MKATLIILLILIIVLLFTTLYNYLRYRSLLSQVCVLSMYTTVENIDIVEKDKEKYWKVTFKDGGQPKYWPLGITPVD